MGQYEQVWVYGSGCGMDFNQASPDPVIIPTSIEGHGEASASVCDDNGQLLFYTNGFKVWDRNGIVMPNGNGLVNDPVISPIPIDVISSTSQGAIIIPWPEKKGKYYIFSMTAFEAGVNIGRLYVSVIDMTLNGGMGDVDPTAKGIFIGGGFTEHMTGVVGDRCNVWLLVIDKVQEQLIAYSISSEGIDTSAPVASPLLPLNYYSPIGQMDVSPDRRKLAIPRAGICLYDFDPATGIATGKVELTYVSSIAYSTCFSPDNSKLYASFIPFFGIAAGCFQFDLNAPDSLAIVNSKFLMPQAVTRFKRGPYGKMYTTGSLTSSVSKGIIHYPDLPGLACQFEMLNLPGDCTPGAGASFPGFPHVVPAIRYDTFYAQQTVIAPCFTSQVSCFALNEDTGWDYVWNTGDNGTSLAVESPGTYWVSYHTPPCSFNVDTFLISFPHGMLPDLYIDTSCANIGNGRAYVSTYAGDTVTYSYTWTNGPGDTLSTGDTLSQASSGNYKIYIHTIHCDTMLSFFIPEADHRVSFRSDSIVCMGSSLTFQNTSPGQFTAFTWRFGDGDSLLAAQPPAHPYPHPGRYEVMLAGSGTVCSDTSYKTIIVDSLLSGEFVAEPRSICSGQSIVFTPQSDSTALSLSWQWGDGNSRNGPNESTKHAYDNDGILSVKLTSHFRACPDTSFADTVYVYPLPDVYLGPDSALCLGESPVFLQNMRPAPTAIYSQLWSTGESTERIKVVHPGAYSLTVSTEPLGCSTTETITINKDCYIDIPNAFTPNGDGINDYFFPRLLLSRKVTRFKMQVLNRWGQLIFETSAIDGRGWDGKFNDKSQSQGVYVYRIDLEIDGRLAEHYQGNVTLIR